MSNNGEIEKKPLPEFKEEWKDVFLHVALRIIENLSKHQAMIAIKTEALESFPENEKPIFAYNKSKEHWQIMNPNPEKKIVTPKRNLILPTGE